MDEKTGNRERGREKEAIDEVDEQEDAASPFREAGGEERVLKRKWRNGLRKLLEFGEYKSFPMAVIRFSRVFEYPPWYNPTFCPIARNSERIFRRNYELARARPPQIPPIDLTKFYENRHRPIPVIRNSREIVITRHEGNYASRKKEKLPAPIEARR